MATDVQGIKRYSQEWIHGCKHGHALRPPDGKSAARPQAGLASGASLHPVIPVMARSVVEWEAIPLIGIPPPYIPSQDEEWGSLSDLIKAAAEYDEYAGWLRSFCVSSGYQTVDFRACFEERVKRDKATPDRYFFDGLHFNAEGHQVLAACMVETVKSLWGGG